MPRLIFKCPYLKSGSTKHKGNLISYMATRSGVQKIAICNGNVQSTKNQEKIILQILKEFPDTKKLFEYEDYIRDKTIENASEFINIAIEHNFDMVAKKEKYVDYIANRPRVEKISSHGLFDGGSDEIVLSKVSKEVSEHEGNVWLPIISLRREDAINTGFDNVDRWKNYLSSYAPTIAESLKIPLDQFRWYAAFHNESHHPHIHMICYCRNARHGFLDKKGIAKIKSGLVSGIFKQEMIIIYAQQTKQREALKAESKKVIGKLIFKIIRGEMHTENLEKMFLELSEKLKGTKSKRVYGYLPPRIKDLVDSIVEEIAKEPLVAQSYKLWSEMRNEITASYHESPETIPPLSQQKEFKSIKNYIIYEADKFAKGEITLTELDYVKKQEVKVVQDEIIDDKSFLEPIYTENEIETRENMEPYVKWTEEYKQARILLFGDEDNEPDFQRALELMQMEAQNGNMLATFDLGRIHADGLGVEIDNEQAQECYKQALDGFLFIENKKSWKYIEYRIGKMYAQGLGTNQNYELAADWLNKSVAEKYKFAEYSLGSLYYYGHGVEQCYEKAFELYLRSAKQDFPYANFEVAKMFCSGIGTEQSEKKSTYHFEKAYIGFVDLEKQSHDDKIQYRLGCMLQNGIGTEKDIVKAKEYFEKSAKLGNIFACYSLAKLILVEDSPTEEDVKKALEYLKVASDSENEFAQYFLAKLYYKGEYLEKSISKALKLFSMAAEQGNEWAAYALGKIYLTEESYMDIQKAVIWLKESAEKKNQFAQYQLGKLYLQGDKIPKDNEKAIHYISASAEQGNQFAQYIIGKLYLMGKVIPKNKEMAIKWFTLSAEQGNEYAQYFLDNMDNWKEPVVSFAITRLMHHMSRIFENNQPTQKTSVTLQIDSKRMRKLRGKKIAHGHKCDNHEQQLKY